MRTVESKVNNWTICSVYEKVDNSTLAVKRWYTSNEGDWSILVAYEYRDSYPYRCSIKHMGSGATVMDVGKTPRESFRFARKKLNDLRTAINNSQKMK